MYGLMGSFTAARSMDGLPGCLSDVVAEDLADEVTIWVTDVWTDAAAHQAALQRPAVNAVIARARPLIAAFGEHCETPPAGGHGLAH